ncbi:hypothetical protein HPB49_003064 [Dermacentor silvarum]|uniref:Uncharacterized protein n=1 Tax=Dermacentor silvarum TaxID=543639 RepID=A0ACB8DT87_DERSI|nr:hypothetical protein HPB49_003064 [Dermacentor silvarum]
MHVNSHLNDIDKFQYLRSSIDGPTAKAIIPGFLTTENCYTDNIEILKEWFGYDRNIEAKYLENLRTLIPYFFWTDSMVALRWVKGSVLNWKPFVQNRVFEIEELTDPSQQNDCSGRGKPVLERRLLWKGLAFQGDFSGFTLHQTLMVERASLARDLDRIASDYNCRDLPTTWRTTDFYAFEHDYRSQLPSLASKTVYLLVIIE